MKIEIGDYILYQFWNNYSYTKHVMQITKIARKYVYGRVAYMHGEYLENMKCAISDILEVKKVGETTRPSKTFDDLSQTTWSKETIDLARKFLFPKKRNNTIIEELNYLFDGYINVTKHEAFKNNKIVDKPEYWEKKIDAKLPQNLRQSIINDLKKMTLGYRDYYRLPEEVRSRLTEILYSLNNSPEMQALLLRATPKKFEEYFLSRLGDNYLLFTPEQKKYILNNVYQSLRGGRQQTIINKIINFTQNAIKQGLFPENIGNMAPIEIKKLLQKPEIQNAIKNNPLVQIVDNSKIDAVIQRISDLMKINEYEELKRFMGADFSKLENNVFKFSLVITF